MEAGIAHRLEITARDQRHDEREMHHVGNRHLALLIPSDTAPVGTTAIARDHDRAAQAGWGVDAFAAQRGDQLATLAAVDRRQAPGVVGGHRAVRHQRRRCHREGLCRPGLLAGYIRRRYRPFLDLEQGRAGFAVEGEQQAHLGGQDHRR
jgi:hypothetical protein